MYFRYKKPISRFIKETSINLRKLKMNKIYYDSSHGLSNLLNYSIAYDISQLHYWCV